MRHVSVIGTFAGVALFSLAGTVALAAFPIGKNIAPLGTPLVSGGPAVLVVDQDSTSQLDTNEDGPADDQPIWTAVTFGGLKRFNKIIIEQCPGFVSEDYEIQVAKDGILAPNPAVDADWEAVPVGTFVGQASNSDPSLAFNQTYNRAGVRLNITKPTAGFAIDDRARVREMYVFENYSNLATSATITAPGWGQSGNLYNMVNVQTIDQDYTTNLSGSPFVTFSWGSPVDIGAVMIHGGSGSSSEHLIAFKIEYFDGVNWVNFVDPITNNGAKTTYHLASYPVTTQQLRLNITNADASNQARIGEVFIFAPVPEPASLGALTGLGVLLVRRGARRA